MIIDTVHINDIPVVQNSQLIKKKRERFVYKNGGKYYKIWVPDWTQGDITKYALDKKYYCDKNAAALLSLIVDDNCQRGYITKEGQRLGDTKDWGILCSKTSKDQRREFILSLLENSFYAKGMFVDLVPSNLIVVDNKISLIDLDSFNSFDLIFRRKRAWYEKFDLDAWWKPHETAKRDTDKFYRSYFNSCLGITIDFPVDSEEAVTKLLEKIK